LPSDTARHAVINRRLVGLQAEVALETQLLIRFYNSTAAVNVEMDDLLGDRVANLKGEREDAQAALTGRRASPSSTLQN
jgi:hypothetical protein